MFYLCSENKGADQLRSYCAADLRLCFRICKKPGFLLRLIYVNFIVSLILLVHPILSNNAAKLDNIHFSNVPIESLGVELCFAKNDFLKMGMCYEYLHKQIMHSFCVYNQSLTTASGSRLFGSVVRALDFCPGGTGFISRQGQVIFSYALFLFIKAFICPPTPCVNW